MKRLRTASTLPLRASALLVGSVLVSACGGIIPAGKAPATGAISVASGAVSYAAPSRPGTAPNRSSTRAPTPPPIARVSSAPLLAVSQPEDMACISQLNAAGAQFNPLPDAYGAPGCTKLGTVQLLALAGDGGQFTVSNIGALKCSAANAFNGWVRFGVDRAARQILGSGLKQVETLGSYACRNVAGTERRSAHARAEAIDVSGFVLADGRRIVLKDDWSGGTAAEREFLRVVQKSACKRFGTVLGPEYNAAHEDHFHLEEGSGSFCR
jgi:hypothetical protein